MISFNVQMDAQKSIKLHDHQCNNAMNLTLQILKSKIA